MNSAMRRVVAGNYIAEFAISSWQPCYGIGSEPGFAFSLAGQFSLRNQPVPVSMEVHEVTLCAGHTTGECLSQGMTIAPRRSASSTLNTVSRAH